MEGKFIPVIAFAIDEPYRIIRSSIYTFLKHYQQLAIAAALLALPFSALTLLSLGFIPSSPLLHIIQTRFHAIFTAAGFPQSDLLSLLCLKLSQSVLTASYTLPCSMSFLLVAKAYTIKALATQKSIFPLSSSSLSLVSMYGSLVHTYNCSVFLIVAANGSAFSLVFMGFNFCHFLGIFSPNFLRFVSLAGAVAYSIILANVLVICNLASVISGMDQTSSGFSAMLKACILMKGRTSTALLLALPISFSLTLVEGLFQYRIFGGYPLTGKLNIPMVLDCLLIAYLYSFLLILDMVMSCIFLKSCRRDFVADYTDRYSYRIEINQVGESDSFSAKLNGAEELPCCSNV